MRTFYPIRLLLIALLTGLFSPAFAGDDPCSATGLTVGTSYSALTVTNSGATNSSVPDATCDGGTSDGDIWYTALVGANGTLIIETRPGTLTDIGMAIYTGPNCSTLSLNSCVSGGTPGFANMPYKSITGLSAGTRVYIRLWDVGNDDVGTFQISAYVNCNASVTITGATSGCSSTNTQICATAGFSNYSWTGGLGTACINVNSTGTYTVTVTDADGCTATDSHSFTSLTTPTVSITGPSSGCSADLPQLCVPAGFSGYSWSSGATTRCINPSSSGGYTITVTAANGCTASDTKLISIYASPSVTVTGPPSKCAGSSDQLCVPPGYSSYAWSNGGTTNCINPSSTATYSVTVTDLHGCTSSASQAMTINPNPSITVSGPATACPGSSPQFCVAGGYSNYAWSNGGTTNCINPSATGTYTITVTDAFGCTGSASKGFTFFSPVNVSVSGPASTCAGTNVQLCATSGMAGYSWSNGSTTACITPSASGNYTVIATDNNGCTGSDSHAFTLNTLPTSDITGPPSVCNGGSVQLCAPAGNAFYLWSNNATGSCITATTSGNYSVTVTDGNGCTSSSSHSLTIFSAFALTITGPSTACSGGNTQLCATSGPYTYQWSNGSSSACINPTVSGTYTVIATNANGCTKSASKGLTIYSPLNASITGPSSACIGSVVPLCASSGSNSYAWSNGATTECINVNSNGIYDVIITDVNGCTGTASQVVTFSNTFNVQITGPVSGCNGNTSILCVPTGYTSYAWSTGETTECINVSTPGNYSVTIHDPVGCVANSFYNLPFNPPPVVSITGSTVICSGTITSWCATTGYPAYLWSNGGTDACILISQDTTYTVIVTDTNGCTAISSSQLQVVNIQPNIYESGGYLICDTFSTNYEYLWLLNGQHTGCSGDSCLPTFSGIYSVEVSDTLTGCVESTTYNYIATGLPKAPDSYGILVYPNPFSNDQFNVKLNNLSSEKVIIAVSDALGKQIYYEMITVSGDEYEHTVHLPSFADGLYYLNVQTPQENSVRKIFATR